MSKPLTSTFVRLVAIFASGVHGAQRSQSASLRPLGADAQVEALLDGAGTVQLAELDPDPVGQVDAYRQAVTNLARALAHLSPQQEHDWSHLSAELLKVGANFGRQVSALTLQMTALANLLDTAHPPADAKQATALGAPASAHQVTNVRKPVEDRLSNHEQRYWRDAAATYGLDRDLDNATLLDTLATAMLFGADDQHSADDLLEDLPALERQTRARRNTIRRWIADLYPPVDLRPWGSLQPDRLAEHFVGKRLTKNPDLVDSGVLSAATLGQINQLLTVYTRAANHPIFLPQLGEHLMQMVIRYHNLLALPAIDIATQVEAPGPLIAALQQLTTDPDISPNELAEMVNRLPSASLHLADWAVILTQRLVDEYRRLANADPDTFLPNLTAALYNLAFRLGGLGRREEALAASQEAVAICRKLAARDPDVFQQQLDQSAQTLARLQGLDDESTELSGTPDQVT